MKVQLELGIDIERTARVHQLEGMFDVPEAKRAAIAWDFDMPLDQRPWQVGLICGPSGAGKSSVARHLFATELVEGYDWHPKRSVVDCFGELGINEIVGALSSVGFASPPSWLKPFHVLSNGEKFRATLARAIVDPRSLVVLDEFSSVVDRQVARIGAHATAKAIRARPGKQFVAVTCHEDVLEWLQPDWVCEPHVGAFSWRSPGRRPSVQLEIYRAHPDAWRWFAPHHYLSRDISKTARCWVGLVNGELAAFTSAIHHPHPIVQNMKRLHRTVVLPDYQGLGLALHMTEAVGSIARALGFRLATTLAHPALIRARAKSKRWKLTRAPGLIRGHHADPTLRAAGSGQRRRTASFEYIGPKLLDRDQAQGLWGERAMS
jgi:GNAT superfamily N-acetyltransferase